MARVHHEGRGVYPLQPARTLFWLGLFLVLSVALIVLDQLKRLQPAEDVAAQVFTPVQTTITQKADPLFEFWSTLSQIGQLRENNAKLTQEVQRLELENNQLKRAAAENETMRAQLHYAQSSPQFTLLPATVVGKDLHGLNDYIEIDRGSVQGLRSQMTVVSPDGYLVGRVVSVAATRSRVLVITNPSSSVAAIISDAAGQTEDVVDGKVHGRLVMSNIQQDAKIDKGDEVVTSGLGGNFPKGVKIGQIATVTKSDVELFQEAEVAAYCDLGKLSSVEVITNNIPND